MLRRREIDHIVAPGLVTGLRIAVDDQENVARKAARARREQDGVLLAKLIWFVGAATWFIIRYPHNRRARHTPKASRHHYTRERWLMSISSTGLGILPGLYVLTNEPRFANYEFHSWHFTLLSMWMMQMQQLDEKDLERKMKKD